MEFSIVQVEYAVWWGLFKCNCIKIFNTNICWELLKRFCNFIAYHEHKFQDLCLPAWQEELKHYTNKVLIPFLTNFITPACYLKPRNKTKFKKLSVVHTWTYQFTLSHSVWFGRPVLYCKKNKWSKNYSRSRFCDKTSSEVWVDSLCQVDSWWCMHG